MTTWDGEVCKNWQAVTDMQQSVWCVGCFTREAERKGVAYDSELRFFTASGLPISTTFQETITERDELRAEVIRLRGLVRAVDYLPADNPAMHKFWREWLPKAVDALAEPEPCAR